MGLFSISRFRSLLYFPFTTHTKKVKPVVYTSLDDRVEDGLVVVGAEERTVPTFVLELVQTLEQTESGTDAGTPYGLRIFLADLHLRIGYEARQTTTVRLAAERRQAEVPVRDIDTL